MDQESAESTQSGESVGPITSLEASATTIMERCDLLARFSEEPDRLTRRFATPAMREVNERVATWMRAAGMSVRHDAVGNLIGRYEASASPCKTLLLGSHLDTVRDAGKYDGPLGVLVALECVARLYRQRIRLPFAIEVYGFADEEGLRYHSAYLGSKAVTGAFDGRLLALTDSDNVTLAEAIRRFGGDPDNLATCKRDQDDLIGYCEVHIEQGPVLEYEGLPVGVVSAIQGQSRIEVIFTGVAGHAGTVPSALRRDALCAASEFVLAVEALSRQTAGLVATVGQMIVQPGASNVIPGAVALSLDVRHPDDDIREAMCAQLAQTAQEIATRRTVTAQWQLLQATASVQCDQQLAQLFAQAIEAQGISVKYLPSGAGHDAAVMAAITPIAMLFVRCAGGISHSPAEAVAAADVATATAVLERFLHSVAQLPVSPRSKAHEPV